MLNGTTLTKAYRVLQSCKNTTFTLSKSALFSSSRFLVHVPLNANYFADPAPLFRGVMNSTVYFSHKTG